MAYWLLKSEPSAFSLQDLQKAKQQTTHWDGVRNYQARNMLRDEIKPGDQAFFYHSNCEPAGIAGVVDVVKAGYPDPAAMDPDSKYFDPKSTKDNPRWYMVDVKFAYAFKHIIALSSLKENPLLKNMAVVRKGNRLSVTPVTKEEWRAILAMAERA